MSLWDKLGSSSEAESSGFQRITISVAASIVSSLLHQGVEFPTRRHEYNSGTYSRCTKGYGYHVLRHSDVVVVVVVVVVANIASINIRVTVTHATWTQLVIGM